MAKVSRSPGYVYVASSWRNNFHGEVVATLHNAGIEAYDFKTVPTAFSWDHVGLAHANGLTTRNPTLAEYFTGIEHPRALEGFNSDFNAMQRADAVVLVLPCNRSAHLELGWAVGQGKRTAVVFDNEDDVVPELMYRMVDFMTSSLTDLLRWLGATDNSSQSGKE